MDTHLSKAALLVFLLPSIATANKAFVSVNVSSTNQCFCQSSCLNGGTRSNQCVCKSGFTGIICETDLSTGQLTPTGVTTTYAATTDLPAGEFTPTDMTTTDLSAGEFTPTDMTTTGKVSTGSTGCMRLTGDDYIAYTGNRTQTFTKKPCQRWDSQTPHKHSFTEADMYSGPITNVSQAENYCRNPDYKTGGPWCLTTDPTKRWEYCDIPYCHGCKDSKLGAEYTGTINTIPADDIHCLRWDAVNHTYTPANFSGGITNLTQAENYCRNPNNDTAGPWCFINSTAGQHCDIPICLGCSHEGYYDGKRSTTQSGLTCQRWDSQSPHPHNVTDPTRFMFTNDYNLTHLNEAENYCQIVAGVNRSQPWCFTTTNHTAWAYCNLADCGIDDE